MPLILGVENLDFVKPGKPRCRRGQSRNKSGSAPDGFLRNNAEQFQPQVLLGAWPNPST